MVVDFNTSAAKALSRSQTLYNFAETYLAQDYSVIPVWGEVDPTRPKVAGVEWGIYQRRRPTPSEICNWFLEDEFGGIAIVTGSISHLAVLDFDTLEGFREFSAQHPDLVETQVIQTRRGYHVYFRLPSHLHLPSRKGQGIDLLVEGRYVIARPTCIDGHSYKLIRGGQPKTLTNDDVERITRFVDGQGNIRAVSAPQPKITPPLSNIDGIQPVNTVKSVLKTLADLKQAYRECIEKGRGRNEALFQASLKARDDGWGAEQVIAALADMHVWQPVGGPHRSESLAQRYQEARKTVQSAFSRPARQRTHLPTNDCMVTIPNSVREALFKLGETRTVRLLDGLRSKDIKPGDLVTIKQAIELLNGIVGRDSIYAAFKATNQTGLPIFKCQKPSPTPPSAANAAIKTKTKKVTKKKCSFGRGKKSGISKAHRPATVYIMPSNEELRLLFGTKHFLSDPITLDDLASAKQTRQAFHRELIRRRPGKYPRRWLADRVGVSCKTLDTYNHEIEGLYWRPCFSEEPIYWRNLNAVPDGIEVSGAFLEDTTGKRYPPLRTIAARLLKQGKKIVYKRQTANYYWYGDEEPADVIPVIEKVAPTKPQPIGYPMKVPSYIPDITNQPIIPTLASVPAVSNTSPVALHQPVYHNERVKTEKWDKKVFRKPLKNRDSERTAQQIYNTVNGMSSDKSCHISQARSRWLATNHSREQVLQALKLLQKRKNIRSSVGFLITVLRSESKAKQLQQRSLW